MNSEKETIATLIQGVEAADSARGLLAAVQALAAARHEGAVPTLIAVLGYNNPGAAVAAVEGLIDLGSAAVPSLLAEIDGYNYGARAWAIRALAGIGDPRALDLLLAAAREDFSLSVRRAAAKGLGHIRWCQLAAGEAIAAQERVLEVLVGVLEGDPEWVVRYAAAAGLHALGSAAGGGQTHLRPQTLARLSQRLPVEPELAVRARLQVAIGDLSGG